MLNTWEIIHICLISIESLFLIAKISIKIKIKMKAKNKLKDEFKKFQEWKKNNDGTKK